MNEANENPIFTVCNQGLPHKLCRLLQIINDFMGSTIILFGVDYTHVSKPPAHFNGSANTTTEFKTPPNIQFTFKNI